MAQYNVCMIVAEDLRMYSTSNRTNDVRDV